MLSDKLRLAATGADNRLRIVHVAEMRVWEDVVAPCRAAGRRDLCPTARRSLLAGPITNCICNRSPARALLTGHTAAVHGLAFTPDGKGLARAAGCRR